jgi:hypothetical protein
MTLGDGIRRNIAHVEPSERAALRDAFLELNRRFFGGSRTDVPTGGVSWWFKQDEIHQATHVHGGPEFLPWHREIVNRLEAMLRQINPQLSMHYWDWTQNPTNIPNANLGGGTTGTLNLFTPDFMGFGGTTSSPIGQPWQNDVSPFRSDGYYVPGASPSRDGAGGTPADPPDSVNRSVVGSPASALGDNNVIGAGDYADMRNLLEPIHDAMHGFVRMGGQHISFRDPFVFFLHSNVDRIFAHWQANLSEPAYPARLEGATVYGSETDVDVPAGAVNQNVSHLVEPWSTGHSFDQFGSEHFTRPWSAPENQGSPHNYKHPSVVTPPCYDTLPISVRKIKPTVMDPVLRFFNVPSGKTTARALRLEIRSCTPVHIDAVLTGDPAFTLHLAAVDSPVTNGYSPRTVFVWVKYHAGAPLTNANGHLTATVAGTGIVFDVDITANSLEKPVVAVSAVFDSSGSMSFPSGVPGMDRMAVLHQAAPTFIALLEDDDGVGVVRFDTDAFPLSAVAVADSVGAGGGRDSATSALNGLTTNLAGMTAIGDGIEAAHNQLLVSPAQFVNNRAILVFTDGDETEPKYINEVTGFINEFVYAIGLGTPDQVKPDGLNLITNGTGGYVMLTGPLDTEGVMRLAKYFVQVLAGVTNVQIVTDPPGYVTPGITAKVPFVLTEADQRCDVILLTEAPGAVTLTLTTPDGTTIGAGPDATPLTAPAMSCLRVPLPLGSSPGTHAGNWIANISMDDAGFRKYLNSKGRENDPVTRQRLLAHGLPFIVNVHAVSDLEMKATATQLSHAPGSNLEVTATLTDSGIPLERRAFVSMAVTKPDGAEETVALNEVEPGVHRVTMPLTQVGLYSLLIRGRGDSFSGKPFTREELRTAATWIDQTGPNGPGGTGGYDRKLVDLIIRCCRWSTRLMFAILIILLILLFLLILLLTR